MKTQTKRTNQIRRTKLTGPRMGVGVALLIALLTTMLLIEPVTSSPQMQSSTPTPAEEAAATVTATPMEEAAESTPTASESSTSSGANGDELIRTGEQVYAAYCAACHQLDGQGIVNAFPPLAGNGFVMAEDPSALLHVIFTGRAGMPHFRDYLTETEIAAVVSYIRSGWTNEASIVTLEEVQRVRQEIYSPSEPTDHNGASEKEGSNERSSADSEQRAATPAAEESPGDTNTDDAPEQGEDQQEANQSNSDEGGEE